MKIYLEKSVIIKSHGLQIDYLEESY